MSGLPSHDVPVISQTAKFIELSGEVKEGTVGRLVLVLLVTLGFQAVPASAAAGCERPLWQVVRTPNYGASHNELRDIAALSATDAWSVGSSTDEKSGNPMPLVEHWDGTAWDVVPHAGPDASGGLYAVDALTADDVWAVGILDAKAHIQHWDGTAWDVVDAGTPDPGEYGSTWLKGVAAIATDDAWAVGAYEIGGPPQPMIVHWDGTAWKVADAPAFETWTELTAVSATGPDDVWAVGSTEVPTGKDFVQRVLIEHWDGESWTVETAPYDRRHPLNPWTLEDVAALSGSDAWAVGNRSSEEARTTRTLALHWDGVQWRRARTVNPSRVMEMLTSVAGFSSSRVWAVGFFVDPATHRERPLVELWDGQDWRKVSGEDRQGGGDLYGVVTVPGWQFATGSFWSKRLDAYRTLGLQRCRG